MAASMRTAPFCVHSFTLDDAKGKDTSLIQDHYFNHAMTVILPGATMVPSSLLQCFSEQMTFKLHRLPLYTLIERPFIQAFVKKGAIHVLSINTKLDTDDCVAVTPTGSLILHLTKDTFQELGLESEKQTPTQKKQDVYVVKINLMADHFVPGKKGYDRTLWCLKDRLDLVFDFLVTWDPHDEEVCSSSVGVYFADKCERVERMNVEKTSRILTSLPSPRIDAAHPEGSEASCNYREVFEWMGAIACGIDLTAEDIGPDSYTSTLTCPEPSYNCPRCCVFQIKGLLSPKNILKAWKILREHASSSPEHLPASLTIHGFSDCPVNAKTVSHNFYIAGDNIYSFLLLPNDRCWAYTASVS